MSVNTSVNGITYPVPVTGETDWGGSLDGFLQALATACSSVLMWGCSALTAGTGTYFLRPGYVIASADTTEVVFRVPTAGRLKNLYIRVGTVAIVGGEVFTVRVNGSDSSITCTLAAGASVAQDTIDTAPVNAGDFVSVKVVSTSTTHPTQVLATLSFVPG